ncbi:MAG: outer membrane beta-barrel domain-containing protein [Deltaproteobacteria bacterium]|nr:outer membrane beta-barrel domain-containing protein [Deltaproteobacteria bacterium]MBK8237502.1 outer membrane beta-barrel domain-containing protein [Deltaproteobacteria bacterium]MBP7290699.1 outer membrane beta-barrel domain-containing protein [Nannocystaceae bacterium]
MLAPLLTLALATAPEADAQACAKSATEATATATTTTPRRRGRRGRDRDAPTSAAAAPVGVPGQPGECVDATLQEQLLAKRRFRLTRDRLFVKALRHELTLNGGYYVSDLFDSTFTLGGQYTFFMSENFGTELSVSWSRLRTSVLDTIEGANAFAIDLGRPDVVRAFGSLTWSPLYGKLRLVAASIWRYDLYLLAGPGVVVDPLSFGAAGNFGLGFRVFLHQAVALRFEVRDYLYRQELLSESFYVNDLAFTTGLSVLLPTRN